MMKNKQDNRKCCFSRGSYVLSVAQKGRTMVELLAVLAIMGILATSCFVGYQFAIQSYREGETINEITVGVQGAKDLNLTDKYGQMVEEDKAKKAYVVPVEEVVSNVEYMPYNSSSSTQGAKVYQTKTSNPVWVRVESADGYTVNIAGLSYKMCQQILESNFKFLAAYKGEKTLDEKPVKLACFSDKNETVVDGNCPEKYYLAKSMTTANSAALCSSIDAGKTRKMPAMVYREYLADKNEQLTFENMMKASGNNEEAGFVDMSPLVLYFKDTGGGSTVRGPDGGDILCEEGKPYRKDDYADGVRVVSPVCCSRLNNSVMIDGVCCAVKAEGLTGFDWEGKRHVACVSAVPPEDSDVCQPGTAIPIPKAESEGTASASWCCASDAKGAHGVWVPTADGSSGRCCVDKERQSAEKQLYSGGSECCKVKRQRGRYIPTPWDAYTDQVTQECCEAAGYMWYADGTGKTGVCCDGKYEISNTSGMATKDVDRTSDVCCKAYGQMQDSGYECHKGTETTCCCNVKAGHPGKLNQCTAP